MTFTLNFVIYILGILTGLISSLFLIKYQTQVTREVTKISKLIGPKGQILEPDDEELSQFINNLPTE